MTCHAQCSINWRHCLARNQDTLLELLLPRVGYTECAISAVAKNRAGQHQSELQVDGVYLALDLLENEGQKGGEVANGYTPQSLRGHSLHLF